MGVLDFTNKNRAPDFRLFFLLFFPLFSSFPCHQTSRFSYLFIHLRFCKSVTLVSPIKSTKNIDLAVRKAASPRINFFKYLKRRKNFVTIFQESPLYLGSHIFSNFLTCLPTGADLREGASRVAERTFCSWFHPFSEYLSISP